MMISLVIPVFNEEENIQSLCKNIQEALDSLRQPYEVIFVDDGSQDGTLPRLMEIKSAFPALRILSFQKNAGQAAAFDAGFKAARGEIVVTLDGDGQYDPHDIPRLLQSIKDYDAVVGWRHKRQDTFLRRLVSRLGNQVRRYCTGDTLHDTGCSLAAYKRTALGSIKLYKGLHRFIPSLLVMAGHRVLEVPVNHFPRSRGKSKYGFWNRVFQVMTDLFVLRWMKRRYLHYEISKEV